MKLNLVFKTEIPCYFEAITNICLSCLYAYISISTISDESALLIIHSPMFEQTENYTLTLLHILIHICSWMGWFFSIVVGLLEHLEDEECCCGNDLGFWRRTEWGRSLNPLIHKLNVCQVGWTCGCLSDCRIITYLNIFPFPVCSVLVPVHKSGYSLVIYIAVLPNLCQNSEVDSILKCMCLIPNIGNMKVFSGVYLFIS